MPDKFKTGFLSGNMLKIIAILTMTIDHIGAYLLPRYLILRIIGRIALPIFAFMIAEGCRYTRNRARYLGTMLGMSFIFQAVYFMVMKSLEMCIFVTFSLSISLIYVLDYARKRKGVSGAVLAFFGVCAVYGITRFLPGRIEGFSVDYGFWGVMLPVLIYMSSDKWGKLSLTAIGLLLLFNSHGYIQLYAFMALPLLALYDGSRGKWKMKYLFYIYYPLHLVVIYLIGFLCL